MPSIVLSVSNVVKYGRVEAFVRVVEYTIFYLIGIKFIKES